MGKLSRRFYAVLILGLAACAGHPVTIGIYTPYPEENVFAAVEKKVTELGYTVVRSDVAVHELVAERAVENGIKEEISIKLAPDVTSIPKLSITSARVLPATAGRPITRVAASRRTSGDANQVLQLFMKDRPNLPPPGKP